MRTRPRILGRLLVEAGSLSEERLAAALVEQRRTGERLGVLVVRKGLVEEEAVARCLAAQLGLPYAEPPLSPEPGAPRLVQAAMARGRTVLPLAVTPRAVRLAMADPLDLATVDDVRFQSGRHVEPIVAAPSPLREAIGRSYGDELAGLLEGPPGEGARVREADARTLEEAAAAGPVVRLVDGVLARAIEERASDIHMEHEAGELRVRYRVDGVLRTSLELPPTSHAAILSRIKVMAGMDISVKRRPQDGAILKRHGDADLTLRVSTLPVDGGEKVVIRILDPRRAPADLSVLGLAPRDLGRLRAMVSSGQGVILAAGPTGSGKSSTLYGVLGEVDRERRNVVTLEDPVEYRLAGVNQVQIDPRAGLTFPSSLRAVLRQDPDVIMVGEIRDRETAEIAMAAAVTGHLVLSTVHTVDAPGAIVRLIHMGVPPFLVAGGLSGVVAQRLVRTLCRRCRGSEAGCPRCSGGYEGRTGIFQVLVMTDAIREEVVRGARLSSLRGLAEAAGMGSLADDARRKVAEVVTTPHEVGRVIQADPGAALPCPGCRGEVPVEALGCPRCGLQRERRCACGRTLRPGWRFCPWCLRRS